MSWSDSAYAGLQEKIFSQISPRAGAGRSGQGCRRLRVRTPRVYTIEPKATVACGRTREGSADTAKGQEGGANRLVLSAAAAVGAPGGAHRCRGPTRHLLDVQRHRP